MLCWVNPPLNAFDNHYEPIFYIIETGSLPSINDCWQCYQPPVHYVVAAAVGKILLSMGADDDSLAKSFQLLSCLYGILNVGVIYLILRSLPLPDFARLSAFAVVCFLPRHIYMSSMTSNDTSSYLLDSICIYLLIVAHKRQFGWKLILAISLAISIAVFTKYTNYALYPAALSFFGVLLVKRWRNDWQRLLRSVTLLLIIPSLLLITFWAANYKRYNNPLPSNIGLMDPSESQPRDRASLSFFTFNPLKSVTTPILRPGRMSGFWDLIYSSMWYDTEPKFIYYLDGNNDWWYSYYAWLRGEQDYPGDNPAISTWTKAEAIAIKTVGLLVLALVAIGLFLAVRQISRSRSESESAMPEYLALFVGLLGGNLIIAIMLGIGFPVYSAAKASYLLISLPAFAVFLALGLRRFADSKRLQIVAAVPLGLLCLLSATHILRVVYALA